MKDEPPIDVDELLSNGHLSGPQYDDIARRVLPQAKPRKSRLARWSFWSLAALVGGALFTLSLLVWRQENLVKHEEERTITRNEFRPKGAAGAASGMIEVSCLPTLPRIDSAISCRRGAKLVFSANSRVVSGALHAYADHVETGSRIWYFPNANGFAPQLTPGHGTQVLSHAVRIGDAHSPGLYRVTVWFTDHPSTRAELSRLNIEEVEPITTVTIRVLE